MLPALSAFAATSLNQLPTAVFLASLSFALLRRPLVLYQADRQEYLEKDRTFYFDIDESPYFVAQNQEQLEQIIAGMTAEKAAENCEEILKFYGDCETGHAAEAVAKIIKDWIER